MKDKFKKVINANGRMTILGSSRVSKNVIEAIEYAGSNFFIMSEFIEKIQDELKKMLKTKNVLIVNSASAGISLAIAATIYKDKVYSVNKKNMLYEIENEIVIPKGHNIDFGAPIESLINLVGGKVIEAGFSNKCKQNEIQYAITRNTVALMYVVSHHCVKKNIISLNEMIEISRRYKLPLIVDCAAEEDLFYYANLDIDVVIFSGSKALEGPTSGLVFGKNKELIDNMAKHQKVIGRAMKIGKENIYGLYVALKNYKMDSKKIDPKPFLKIFNNAIYYESSITIDSRNIPRIKLQFKKNINAKDLSKKLMGCEFAIFVRDYLANQNILEIDLRNINLDQATYIKKNIEMIIKKGK